MATNEEKARHYVRGMKDGARHYQQEKENWVAYLIQTLFVGNEYRPPADPKLKEAYDMGWAIGVEMERQKNK